MLILLITVSSHLVQVVEHYQLWSEHEYASSPCHHISMMAETLFQLTSEPFNLGNDKIQNIIFRTTSKYECLQKEK